MKISIYTKIFLDPVAQNIVRKTYKSNTAANKKRQAEYDKLVSNHIKTSGVFKANDQGYKKTAYDSALVKPDEISITRVAKEKLLKQDNVGFSQKISGEEALLEKLYKSKNPIKTLELDKSDDSKTILKRLQTRSSNIVVNNSIQYSGEQRYSSSILSFDLEAVKKFGKVKIEKTNSGYYMRVLFPQNSINKIFASISKEAPQVLNKSVVNELKTSKNLGFDVEVDTAYETAIAYNKKGSNILLYETAINVGGKESKDLFGTKGQFLSKLQLEIIAKRKIQGMMPRGPVGGQPLSQTKLTYRTGRFLESIRITYLDYKNSQIKYWYNPIYFVHEKTRRNPKELIQKGISETIRNLFARQFLIIKE